MIHKLSDFFLKSNISFSLEEENFKKSVKGMFGFCIHQTHFVKGAMHQYHLYIWADFAEEGVLNHSEIHLPSDCPYSEKDIIATYFNSFHLASDEYSETYLHLYDFRSALIAYAYGQGIVDLRACLKDNPLWKNAKIYVNYTNLTYCVVYDRENRCVTDEEYQELSHLCLSALKVHDAYHVIGMSDVRLVVTHKDDTNTREWNDIFMTNFCG